VKCAACSHENRDGAKFCEECATPLARLCASCGAELRPTAKFCDECGAPSAGSTAQPKRPVEAAGARKVVTVVFADLIGSTALHERVDAESARRLMERYYDVLRAAVEEHGGTVVKLLGDGVMAAFGVPQVAEDDALRAVRAGMAMQDAFRALVSDQATSLGEVGLRVAVNTGEVVVSGANDDVVGDPVNVAARLQQEARDGDVVIGEATQRLVSTLVTLAPLGSFALKGRAESVKAYRVVSLDRPAGASATPFVGRDDELARISRVYDAAVAAPAARLAVLLGSPGLGKSRLIDELARRQSETATVISAHCDSTGGATFAPLALALRRALHIDDGAGAEALRAAVDADTPGSEPDRARIVDGITTLLAGSPASPEETFFVVRRLLAALAKERPVLLVIDDLHWAEPLLLDLVEHLIQWGSGVPLLVLVGARPELRDSRSSLATPGGLVADVVTLSGLDAGAAMRLAANVIGAADLPAAVAAKVLATSEGNPLFVGELIRMLVQEGALERHGDRWIIGAGLAELEMPPTIHALLAARIERLRAEERIVLERAAVVGRNFSRSAVAELLPRDVTDLDARLEALRRSELIERDTGWFLGEPVLRFHHVLIRDAAYRRVLKGTRAELHARFADWIEARVGESVEHEEIIGWHLEQAHLYLGELGPVDAKGRVLGERASRCLAAAGRRALARDDLPLAAGLLGRALARLDAGDHSRADLALDWCEALLATGDVGPAAAAIAELGRFIADSERLRAWHTCFAGQLTVFTEPQALHATADAVAAAAETLTSLGDAAGEAKAHFVHAQALARLGKIGACEAALDRALAAARRAGDRRRANAVLAGAPLAALWGPSPVTRASGRCLDVVRVLRITQGAPAVEAVALSCQGVLEALRGRTAAARRMIASSRKMVEELGITHRLLEADVFAGQIDLLEGDAVAAERSLRSAYEGLRDLGLGIDAAQAAALLARALLAQGRAAEAESLSHESEALAGDDLKAAIAWRGVRAEALARRGEHAVAVELAEVAVAIAAATDALLDHADARLALAAALRAAGRGGEANAEERRATELWEAKGATLLAERARHGVASVEVVAPNREDHTGAAQTRRRRVRTNAATANASGLDAAVAARDSAALRELFAKDLQVDDHTTSIVFDRQGALSSFGSLISARNPTCLNEPLATLGSSLALHFFSISASGVGRGNLDVGPYEKEEIHLNEVDAEGRRSHGEVFAAYHLDDAIARLYERYAELMPESEARARAAATASAVAAILRRTNDAERWRTACVPDAQMVDHRRLGTWNARGSDAIVTQMGSLRAVADDVELRTLEVLALEPEALLLRRMHSGTERVGGGAYERPLLLLLAFGPDGRVVRAELFDDDAEAKALARFAQIVGDTEVEPPRSVQRRVRANRVTAAAARFVAAFAARDRAALEVTYALSVTVVDHPTGSTYGHEGAVDSFARMFRMEDACMRHEAIATLGESLGLTLHRMSARGTGGGRFDVGEFERDQVCICEADEHDRFRRVEVFAADHLGDAIARLYECYAELLPAGPARERATKTARVAAAMLTLRPNLDEWSKAFSPTVAFTDHRTLGLPSGSTSGRLMRGWDELFRLAESVVSRVDAVLRLEPGAFLTRGSLSGTDRATGGAFEMPALNLFTVGEDDLLSRYECFDPEHEAKVLARFDELVRSSEVEPVRALRRRVLPNAAHVWVARFAAAIRGRDRGPIDALLSDNHETVDHPTGAAWGREGSIATIERLMRLPDFDFRHDILATLGESLGLVRRVVTSRGATTKKFDVADYEIERICVYEFDETGRVSRAEVFATDHLSDAIVRLYALRAEQLPEGPSRRRAAGIARSISKMYRGLVDPKHLADPFAADVEMVDHRRVGLGTLHGAESVLDAVRAFLELVQNAAWRTDDVLALTDNAGVQRATNSGTDRVSGGSFERVIVSLLLHDDEGRICRWETFESEDEAEALARFDELTGATGTAPVAQQSAPRFANAATRMNERFARTWAARDWDAFMALHAPTCDLDDRRRLMRLEEPTISSFPTLRLLFDVPGGRWTMTPIATRGERLALSRLLFEGQFVEGGGDLAIDYLCVDEVDAEGLSAAVILFDLDELDAAYAELDARYEAGEAKAHPHVSEFLRRFRDGIPARDWESFAAICAPGIVAEDHRLVSWGTLRGSVAWVGALKSLVDLAPDIRLRVDHVRTSRFGLLYEGAWVGTRDGGEFEIPLIAAIEIDERSRQLRLDVYDVDQFDDARACFDAIGVRKIAVESRFENSASRAWRVVIEVRRDRDLRRLNALYPPGFRYRDHRRFFELDLDREGFLEFTRPLLEMRTLGNFFDLVATRGERLALTRNTVEVEDDTVGPSAIDSLFLIEVDERGEIAAYDRYDCDDLDAAYAELDARYDAGEAMTSPLAFATMTALRSAWNERDWNGLIARCGPRFHLRDHRLLGWGTTVSDPAEWVRTQQALVELAPDVRIRADHVRLGARGWLRQAVSVGTRDGGAFELPLIMVTELDERGLLATHDLYDPEQIDEAFARFEELNARTSLAPLMTNAATRFNERLAGAWLARNWDAVMAQHAPTVHTDDRRRLMRMQLPTETSIEQLRFLFDVPGSRWEITPIATRGERLALSRCVYEGNVDNKGGALAIDYLMVDEVDADGRSITVVVFDVDDLDAAYAELDARFKAGDGATYPRVLATMGTADAYARRDWDGIAAYYSRDFVLYDHRLLGWGTLSGAAAWIRMQRSLVDLAPDVHLRTDHVRMSGRGYLSYARVLGTRDGGAFEMSHFDVREVNEAGEICRFDLYDVDRFDQAHARFDELTDAAPPEPRFANAASRAIARTVRCFNARDWDAMVATYAPDHRMDDRRRLMRIEVAGDGFFANERLLFDVPGSAWHAELLATRGERFALCRVKFTAGGEDAGPMAVDVLDLVEVDADGRRATLVVFDPDDLDAAYVELDARFTVGEVREYPLAAAYRQELGSALSRRDWEAMASVYAPDLVAHDSRLVGWGTIHGPTEIVKPLKAMLELAPDARLRADHVRVSSRGWLFDSVWVGTRDGGAFESEFLSVVELDDAGKARRVNFYDTHRSDEALARFEELSARHTREPRAAGTMPEKARAETAKPNKADAALVRWQALFGEAIANGDWDAFRKICAPGFVFEDRQRLALVTGGYDLMVASARDRVAIGARGERQLVATLGDRVGISRMLWSGGSADGRFEIEYLIVNEVDEAGLLTAIILFDCDDAHAAQREAWTRWAAIDPVAAPWVKLLTELGDAWNAQDRERVRATLADDVVVEDYRRTGIGRIDGADAYVESMVVLWDLAPDQRVEFGESWLAFDSHALLLTLRREGTLSDGGAFENDYLWLGFAKDGRVTRLELFEPEDVDKALARFEELRPNPLRIPPNTVTRVLERNAKVITAGDWATLRGVVSEDFVFEDRGKRSLVKGGVEEFVRGLAYYVSEIRAAGWQEVLATAGERLALTRVTWRGLRDAAQFEVPKLVVNEVNEEGKLCATILFDDDDRAVASAEMVERYIHSADDLPSATLEILRAWNDHDLERLRTLLPADYYLYDRRRTGVGRLDGPDAYLASLEALFQLSRDVTIETLYLAVRAPHGVVNVTRWSGTNVEGGEFEAIYVLVGLQRGARILGVEIFEIEDLDAALARFEELRPDPSRVAPNAATRAADRIREIYLARDWDTLRALAAPDFVYDDRSKRALVVGDVETWTGAMQFTRQPGFRTERSLLAALGDRIALDRVVWSGQPDGDAFEFERIRLLETGPDGRVRIAIFFDPEDRVAAFSEALERFLAGEAAAMNGRAAVLESQRAHARRDWSALRETIAPDFVFQDHRTLGMLGVLDRDGWIASTRALVAMSPDHAVEWSRMLAWNRHGFVALTRTFGTVPDGGPFENVFISVRLMAGNLTQRFEFFDLAHADRALACFEEFSASADTDPGKGSQHPNT